LPDTVYDLLTERGLAMLNHPTASFAAALRELNSVCVDWTPAVPVRLYFSPGDEEAANLNTGHC
jgi:hypothetical protein